MTPEDRKIVIENNQLYPSENDWEKGYNIGYADGYFSCMKSTWKQQYEKLCEEITQSERQKVLEMLKEYYK